MPVQAIGLPSSLFLPHLGHGRDVLRNGTRAKRRPHGVGVGAVSVQWRAAHHGEGSLMSVDWLTWFPYVTVIVSESVFRYTSKLQISGKHIGGWNMTHWSIKPLPCIVRVKGKSWVPWESTRDIYQHIPPIYELYNGCIRQYGVIFGEQLLGYPPKGTQNFPLKGPPILRIIHARRNFFLGSRGSNFFMFNWCKGTTTTTARDEETMLHSCSLNWFVLSDSQYHAYMLPRKQWRVIRWRVEYALWEVWLFCSICLFFVLCIWYQNVLFLKWSQIFVWELEQDPVWDWTWWVSLWNQSWYITTWPLSDIQVCEVWQCHWSGIKAEQCDLSSLLWQNMFIIITSLVNSIKSYCWCRTSCTIWTMKLWYIW